MKGLLIGLLALGSISAFAQSNDADYARCILDTVSDAQALPTVSSKLGEAMTKNDQKSIKEIMTKAYELAETVCK